MLCDFMGMYSVFTALFLLSIFMVVNHSVYCSTWNAVHTTQCGVTLEGQPNRVIEIHKAWPPSGSPPAASSFSGNLNQTLIFTPLVWWQLDATSLTSAERVERGKKGKRHLAATISGLLGVLLSLKLDVEIYAEMLIVLVFASESFIQITAGFLCQ